MELTIKQRVESGITFLQGKGYDLGKIDLERLDIYECKICVLGQLCGDYIEGLLTLGIWNKDTEGLEGAVTHSVVYGFSLHTINERPMLNHEWKRQLTALRQDDQTEANLRLAHEILSGKAVECEC